MSNWTQASTAVVSLLVGAVGTFILSEIGDRWRSGRERLRHWDDQRLNAYSTFSTETKTTMALLFRIAAHLGNDDQTERMPYDGIAKAALAESFMKRDAAFELVLLLGNGEVAAAARDWVRWIYLMRNMVDAQEIDRLKWENLVKETNARRTAFRDLARKDIRIIRNGKSS